MVLNCWKLHAYIADSCKTEKKKVKTFTAISASVSFKVTTFNFIVHPLEMFETRFRNDEQTLVILKGRTKRQVCDTILC